MAASCCIELSSDDRQTLLDIARHSIRAGLQGNGALQVDLTLQSTCLTKPSASFVTLTINNSLRGCMGSLQATEALAQSVANTAYNAAFNDPRFPSLSEAEWQQTNLEISVLSEMQPFYVDSREDLFRQLQTGVDGLMLEDGQHRSTFLPKVWECLPKPELFLDQLLLKAGLPADYWSDSIRFKRYQTLSFHD